MGWMFDKVVRLIARPQRPPYHCEPFTRNDSTALRTLFDPVTFFWSRAKVAFPAASDISINRPGRIRRCTSGRWRASQPRASPMY